MNNLKNKFGMVFLSLALAATASFGVGATKNPTIDLDRPVKCYQFKYSIEGKDMGFNGINGAGAIVSKNDTEPSDVFYLYMVLSEALKKNPQADKNLEYRIDNLIESDMKLSGSFKYYLQNTKESSKEKKKVEEFFAKAAVDSIRIDENTFKKYKEETLKKLKNKIKNEKEFVEVYSKVIGLIEKYEKNGKKDGLEKFREKIKNIIENYENKINGRKDLMDRIKRFKTKAKNLKPTKENKDRLMQNKENLEVCAIKVFEDNCSKIEKVSFEKINRLNGKLKFSKTLEAVR